MIGTLLKINWLNLKRDYVALGLTFILPIVFFSIFAIIFGSIGGGGGGDGGPESMKVIVVDADGSAVSQRFVDSIDEQDALAVLTERRVPEPESSDGTSGLRTEPFTRDTARAAVRAGRYDVAVVIPEGFGATFGEFGGTSTPQVEVIYDAANPIAAPTVSGLLQASAMMAAPDVLLEKGLAQLETFGEGLTPKQRMAVDLFLPALRGDASFESLDGGTDADEDEGGSGFTGLVSIKTTEARAEDRATDDGDQQTSMVAYYAAGVGVMFLLFSMAGAGGALLEEEENGTLERVLTSNVSMRTLLTGSWLFYAIVGTLQVTLMFLWAAFVFKLDLFTANHLAGFIAMTLVTAAAAAAFGIVLATLCKSRAQLSGMSTIVILIMSALGGSMMPKFVAPDLFAITSPFTFNGWALDGYLQVFWHGDPNDGLLPSVAALWPQLLVLAGLTVVFLTAARLLARRWEVA